MFSTVIKCEEVSELNDWATVQYPGKQSKILAPY